MKRPGFTLVEIMLSAAIMGVLTSIVFFNFSKQNQRQALSQSISVISTEIQHMTANAQSGILFGTVLPKQYGLKLESVNAGGAPMTTFETFGDFQSIPTPAAIYDNGGTETIQTFTFQKFNSVYCLATKDGQQFKRIDLGYSLPGGRFTAVGILNNTSAVINITAPIQITLRDARTRECQRVTLPPNVTTSSQQKLTSCSC